MSPTDRRRVNGRLLFLSIVVLVLGVTAVPADPLLELVFLVVGLLGVVAS